ARQEPSRRQKQETVAREIEHERNKLRNLITALEAGDPSPTILQAIRKREESIRTLEGELALALVPVSPFVLEPEKIRHELAHLAGLLSASAERARPVFK